MNQSNYVLSDSDDDDDELNITNNYDISPYSLNEDGMHFVDIIIRVPNICQPIIMIYPLIFLTFL